MFVVQSTVTSARHISRSPTGLNFSELIKDFPIPVIVGNTVGYKPTKELMESGISRAFVGVGPAPPAPAAKASA